MSHLRLNINHSQESTDLDHLYKDLLTACPDGEAGCSGSGFTRHVGKEHPSPWLKSAQKTPICFRIFPDPSYNVQ